MIEENLIHVGQVIYSDHPPLSTCAADEKVVEAYSKLLPCVLGPYPVTSTISHKITIDQDIIESTISADWASPTPARRELQDDIVDDEHNQPLSVISVRYPRNEKTNQEKAKLREITGRSISWIISSDTSAMAGEESMWCYGNNSRHVTTHWNHLNAFGNFINSFWKKLRKEPNNL